MVLGGAAACGDAPGRPAAWDEEPPPLVLQVAADSVQVTPVVRVRAPDVAFPATVEPDPLHTVTVIAPVTGTLIQLDTMRTIQPGVAVASLRHHEGRDTLVPIVTGQRGVWRPRRRAGQFVWEGDTVGVVQLDGCWLAVGLVDELAATVLHRGDRATVTLRGAGDAVVRLGRVERVERPIPPQRYSARIAVEFCTDGPLPGRTGVSAVAAPGGSEDSLPAVPSSAIVRIDRWQIVFVPRAGGEYLARFVLVGPEVGGQTVIRSGVDRGMLVVTSGWTALAIAARDSLWARTARVQP